MTLKLLASLNYECEHLESHLVPSLENGLLEKPLLSIYC